MAVSELSCAVAVRVYIRGTPGPMQAAVDVERFNRWSGCLCGQAVMQPHHLARLRLQALLMLHRVQCWRVALFLLGHPASNGLIGSLCSASWEMGCTMQDLQQCAAHV